MTIQNNSNTSKSDPSVGLAQISWPKEVLKDVSAAMRRDGFFQTAELVEDALVTLEIEVQRRIKSMQNRPMQDATSVLKVVK